MTLFWIVAAPIITLGLYTIYLAIRFTRGREGIVDQTSGPLSFLFIMWLVVTRTEEIEKFMPFVTMDLSEMIRWRPDDGEVT
jgi:hypothetical protein